MVLIFCAYILLDLTPDVPWGGHVFSRPVGITCGREGCLEYDRGQAIIFDVDCVAFAMATTSTTSKIAIPLYDPDKSYDIYKSALELWEVVTDLPKKKRGAAVALSLPDNDRCSLRSTVLEKLDNATLAAETGLDSLKELLNELLGKDDLEDCLSKYEEFGDYVRTTETISEYIRVFETRYIKIKNEGIILPQEVLAFELLRKASISSDDKKLVSTGLNYAEKDKLFDQAKKILKRNIVSGSSFTVRP